MKILNQNRDKVTIEFSNLELEVLAHGMTKESSYRKRTWNNVSSHIPEELMYHVLMKDTADTLKSGLYKASHKYKTK